MSKNPYGLVPYCDCDTREEVWVIRVSEDVPDSLRTAVGIVAHSLRSAFDLLAGQLKMTSGKAPVIKHEFPVYWNRDQYEAEGRRKVQGASDLVMRLIDQLQPWQRGDRFSEDPLWIIHELDRLDKHNDIILVGVGTRYQVGIGSPGQSVHIEHLVWGGGNLVCPLEDGAEVYRARFGTPEVDVNAEFSFFVAFDQSGVGKGNAVIPTLFQLIQFTEGTINSFVRFFA